MRSALAVLLVLLAGSAHASPPGHQLLQDLLTTINGGDQAAILDFVKKNASSDLPPEARAERLMGLAKRGAPFKVVRFLPDSPGEVRAIVVDRDGKELGLTAELSGAKLARMLLAPPEAIEGPPPKDYSAWKDLPSLAAAVRKDAGDPAIAIAVLRDGKLEQVVNGTRRAGAAGDAVAVDDPWSIGSIGKPICGTVIGRLIESGALDWETTVGQALAGLPMRDEYKAITIDQLLHHRAGVAADGTMTREDVQRIAGGAASATAIRESYARDILARPLIARPGERFEYSNAGFALLGVIAERAAHKPYEQLVRELVFTPLGLAHSFIGSDTLPAQRPSGHVPAPGGWEARNMSGPIEMIFAPAGGGMWMSAADLARFGEAHLRGLRGQDGLLRAATVARLHRGVPEQDGGARLYACGWGIESFLGIETMHTHNGSNGTMRAQLAIFPEANLVVASFVNGGGESEPSPPLQAVLAVAHRYAPRR